MRFYCIWQIFKYQNFLLSCSTALFCSSRWSTTSNLLSGVFMFSLQYRHGCRQVVWRNPLILHSQYQIILINHCPRFYFMWYRSSKPTIGRCPTLVYGHAYLGLKPLPEVLQIHSTYELPSEQALYKFSDVMKNTRFTDK